MVQVREMGKGLGLWKRKGQEVQEGDVEEIRIVKR